MAPRSPRTVDVDPETLAMLNESIAEAERGEWIHGDVVLARLRNRFTC